LIKEENLKVESNEYVIYAFIGCVLFGTSNFITGHLSGKLGVPGGYPSFIGNFLCWFLYHLCDSIYTKKMRGYFWNKHDSLYWDGFHRRPNYYSIYALILRGSLSIAMFYAVIYTLKIAADAHVN
jgi:hypothetical protein